MALTPTRTMPVRLRRATEADLCSIKDLVAALGYRQRAVVVDERLLGDALARSDIGVFLAVADGGSPVGLLVVSCRPQLHLGGCVVCVDTLVVSPLARGRGVGQRMLRRVRAFARANRALRVELHTNRGRESYRRGFYAAQGYAEANSALFRLHAFEGQLAPVLEPPPADEDARRPFNPDGRGAAGEGARDRRTPFRMGGG